MEKKYVATVMQKIFISPDNYIFVCKNPVVGEYDEEENKFIDIYGNEYMYMRSEEALNSEIPYSVYNIIPKNKLKEALKIEGEINEKDEDEFIGLYGDYMKSLVYYIGYSDDYLPVINILNTEELKKINNLSSDVLEAVQNENMSNGCGKLIIDVLDDKYTKTEIKSFISNLEVIKDEVETTIGTLETKVEAIDNNKPFAEYLNEKLNKEKELPTKPKPKVKTAQIVPKEEAKTSVTVSETKETDKEKRIDIEELYKKVTKVLIAQDEPAKRVIAEIVRKEMDARKKSEGILLTGPTGVGKTELMKQIAKNIDRPFYKIDSTQITVPGYVGKDIEKVLWDLYVSCNKNKEQAEHAIIYFDEIDKKGTEKKNEVYGRGVLNILLSFIEGTVYDAAPDSKSTSPVVQIDTSNMTVILGGAFTDVYKGLTEKSMGFDKNISSTPKYRKAETKDFVEKGMMTDEFMGRVTVIKLNDLDIDSLKRIILESDNSSMKIQQNIFNKLGVKLTFTDEFINKIAERAYKKKTGARGLNGIIDEATWKAFVEMYNCQDNNPYQEVKITEKTIEDNSNYQLVKRKQKNKK